MNKIYLDSNFLVDCFVRKEPELKKRARILLAKLLKQFDILSYSTLTIDEFWKGLKMEITYTKQIPYSDDYIFSQLEVFTKKILSYEKMEAIQFQNLQNGIEIALSALKEFSLLPRDAFHLAIMRDNDITAIVSRDKKFITKQQEMGIKIHT